MIFVPSRALNSKKNFQRKKVEKEKMENDINDVANKSADLIIDNEQLKKKIKVFFQPYSQPKDQIKYVVPY